MSQQQAAPPSTPYGAPISFEAAKKAIEKNDDVVYDVASGKGQIVGNVKHMPWFREAVADELETR